MLSCHALYKAINFPTIQKKVCLIFRFAILQIANKKSCLDLCRSRPECNWFTFSPDKDFCQLFKNCLVMDLEICPNCKSGHKNCLDIEQKCGVQGECQGITIEHEETAMTAEECHKLCKKTPACRWFTFYKEISQCSLFETCNLVNCNNCNSGEKICANIKSGK